MTSPSMHLRAPGWYPAPDDSTAGAERWWDGTAWTDRLRGSLEAPVSAHVGGQVSPAETLDQRIARAKRDATWAPLGLSGASLLGLALIPVFHVIGVAFITLAVVGVVAGGRAVRLRLRGVAIPIAPPVLGVVIGSLSALALGGMLVLSFVARLG